MADIGHASEKFFRATVAHSSAIPAKAGIQCMKRALRAPFEECAAADCYPRQGRVQGGAE